MKHLFLNIFLVVFSLGQCLAQSERPDENPWQITVTNPENYVGIALSSGRIGIMPSSSPFKVESIILNNVYDKESEEGVSKILLGINFANLDVVIDGDTVSQSNISGWKQTLDMNKALLTTSFRFKEKAEIEYTIYALRGLPYVGLIDVTVKALAENISISVAGKIVSPAQYKEPRATFRVLKDNEIKMPLLQTVAKSPFQRQTLATTSTFIFNHEFPELNHSVKTQYNHQLSFERKMDKGETYNFAWCGAVCSSQDFSDPKSESERMVIYMMRGNKSSAISQHEMLWNKLWQGDIVIEGDLESQRDVRLALFHLYSFSRDDSNLSIAPMGLSSLNYNGHIFWDSELWMFPPLLVFNQEIANSLLNYRFDRLQKAKQKARNFGFEGAMFPWESDDTGEEATPTWALTGTFEHHITADVGIAFWNYFRVTNNLVWLKEKGFPVMSEVANFWVSRAEKNKDGSYSIRNVVGADEFAPNVDDNAFTNGSVKTALSYAIKAAALLGAKANPNWKEVAENLKFNNFGNGVMKEHKTYNGEVIKQADVNLLAYPLELITDENIVKRDLEYYEPLISKEGPAMGLSVLSVIYARMGNSEKAFDLFKRSYIPNKRSPFGALAESATSNNPYFATGAGGMLQEVIFGFGGLHFTEAGIIETKPCLPKAWKKLVIKGVGPQKKTFVFEQ